MRFLFYDIETANDDRSSICAIGWLVAEGLAIVDQGYTLINPHVPFGKKQIKIHGITEMDVIGAPTFAEYWNDTLSHLASKCVFVAHSAASFDIPGTKQALLNAGITDFSIRYHDFLPLAQHMLPELKNHKLNTIADWAGVSFRHHCASEDVLALFEIAKTLCEHNSLASLDDLFAMSPAPIRCATKTDDHDNGQCHHRQRPRTEEEPIEPIEIIDQSLAGCVFCVTGNVHPYSKPQIKRMIMSHSGEFKTSVSKKTNILVVGTYDPPYPADHMSDKHEKAIQLVKSGHPIQIIPGHELLKMFQNIEDYPVIREIRKLDIDQCSDVKCNSIVLSPEFIQNEWNRLIHEDTDDEDAFSFSATQSGFSFFIYGKKSFELVNGTKKTTLKVCAELKRMLFPKFSNIDEDKFYALSADDLPSLFSVLKKYKNNTFRNIITDTFACCSKFVKCSDARQCLHPNDRTYNGCYYRKNLEKGLIFYGKNRNANENGFISVESDH